MDANLSAWLEFLSAYIGIMAMPNRFGAINKSFKLFTDSAGQRFWYLLQRQVGTCCLALRYNNIVFAEKYYFPRVVTDLKFNSQLFLHYNGLPLSWYQFSSVLSKIVKVLDIRLGYYPSHSFRLGATTEADIRAFLKKWGRWCSGVYRFDSKSVQWYSTINLGDASLPFHNANKPCMFTRL